MSDKAESFKFPPVLLYDYRRRRAEVILAAVMRVISKHLDRELEYPARKLIDHDLFNLLYENGAEVITDADRKLAGLRPRGDEGLTAEELQVLEHKRMELMLRAVPPVIIEKVSKP